MIKYCRSGIFLSLVFLLAGLIILLYILHSPPKGIFLTLFSIFSCIFFFLMVPRAPWMAKQLRFRNFVATRPPYASVEEAWAAFEKEDILSFTNDPLLRRWQSLVDSVSKNDKS